MTEATVKVGNKNGIHMRPAMKISDISNKFRSKITIESEHYKANAKSFVEMAMLVATHETSLKVTAKGEDEVQAVKEISILIENDDEETIE